MSETPMPLATITPRDIRSFAEGMVEAYRAASEDARTQEARLLYALAEAYLETYEAARDI